MKNLIATYSIAVLFLFAFLSTAAQNGPGKIIRQAPTGNGARAILDQDGNDYVSASTAGFSGNDDVTTSEIKYKPILPYSVEPYGDLRRGPDHKFSDFVPGIDNASYYMYYYDPTPLSVNSGDEALLFRMRMGSVMPGAKGYSILIDTDGKFGATGANADPGYKAATTGTGGNPGFEVEIVLATGGGNDGVLIYNVNDTESPSAPTVQTGWTNFSQVAIAATNDNGDPDFYLDFYVTAASLAAVGINATTPLRVVPTTVMAPKAAIGGPKSDIYGLSDDNYTDPNAQYEDFINAQPPVTPTTLGGNNTNSTNGARCTAPPVLTSPITPGSGVSVGGTWTRSSLTGAASAATIKVYVNGVLAGQTSGTVTSTGSAVSWSVPGLTISNGQTITAKAVAAGESECLSSNAVVASNCNNTTRPVQPTGVCGDRKGFAGTNYPAGATISIYKLTATGTTLLASGIPTGTGNSGFANDGAGGWKYENGCTQGGGQFAGGTYIIYFTQNGCDSRWAFACAQNTNGNTTTTLAAPVINNASSIYNSTTSISGTNLSGATVRVYIDDILQGTATVTGTNWTYTFTSPLSVGQVVRVGQVTPEPNTSTFYCSGQTTATVVCYTTPPAITTDANNQLRGGQAITGSSGESAGTIVRVYTSGGTLVSTTTVQANGTWSTTNAGSTPASFTASTGTSYYATAQNGTCGLSSATATFATPAVTNASYCGTITNGSILNTETTLSLSFGASVPSGSVITIYQDGASISSTTLSLASTTTTIDVTGKLYTGGVLSIGIKEGTNGEVICGNTRTVTCTGPGTPTVTYVSCTNCTSNNPATITTGGSVTYQVSNLAGNTYYSIRETTSGKSLATGQWTPSTPPGSITITSNPLTAGGAQNAVVVATSVAASGTCSVQSAAQSFNVILPAQMLEFKGKRSGAVNVLEWKTANERAVRQFEVERSEDGITYSTIGTKASGQTVYTFTDGAPASGINYYRLRIVDEDGRYAYSKIIALHSDGTAVLNSARPNPFHDKLSIDVILPSAQTINVTLFDGAGRVVKSGKFTCMEGLNTVHLTNIQSPANGIYLLQVSAGHKIFQQKLIKAD